MDTISTAQVWQIIELPGPFSVGRHTEDSETLLSRAAVSAQTAPECSELRMRTITLQKNYCSWGLGSIVLSISDYLYLTITRQLPSSLVPNMFLLTVQE